MQSFAGPVVHRPQHNIGSSGGSSTTPSSRAGAQVHLSDRPMLGHNSFLTHRPRFLEHLGRSWVSIIQAGHRPRLGFSFSDTGSMHIGSVGSVQTGQGSLGSRLPVRLLRESFSQPPPPASLPQAPAPSAGASYRRQPEPKRQGTVPSTSLPQARESCTKRQPVPGTRNLFQAPEPNSSPSLPREPESCSKRQGLFRAPASPKCRPASSACQSHPHGLQKNRATQVRSNGAVPASQWRLYPIRSGSKMFEGSGWRI